MCFGKISKLIFGLLSICSFSVINGKAIDFTDNIQKESPVLKFQDTIFNFGKLQENGGPVSHTFQFKNLSGKPVVIYNVLSSCGCTIPVWTKKPIAPNATGEIKATYNNDQGPYPFDKSLTVYTSASEKPYILRITGIVIPKGKNLSTLYPEKIGPLGVQTEEFNHGRIYQGCTDNGKFIIANLSKSPVNVKYCSATPGFSIKGITPNPIPAGYIATLTYSINTGAQTNWGNTEYTAHLICNGAKTSQKIKVHALVTDDYSQASNADLNNAPLVLCEENSKVLTEKKTNSTSVTFSLQNIGKQQLIIRKAEPSHKNVSVKLPAPIAASQKGDLTVKIDNTNIELGETSYTITLITNSPTRPLVLLFISCTLT